MSEQTKIQWANHTGSPFLGCSIVSPGCIHCYAKALAETRLEPIFRKAYKAAGFTDCATRPVWGDKSTRVLSKGFWEDAKRINAKHAKAGTTGHWFPSMMDWLDEMPAGIIDQEGNKLNPVAVLADFLKLIHDTPNLTWILLTKRPENWERLLTKVVANDERKSIESGEEPSELAHWVSKWMVGIAPQNVWILASVENKDNEPRIVDLLKIPAVVRGLSVEPMLGPVDIGAAVRLAGFDLGANAGRANHDPSIDWVIFGGESGKDARPCNVAWIRDGVKQCKVAGVPVFVKQLGASIVAPASEPTWIWPDGTGWQGCKDQTEGAIYLKDPKGGDMSEWPEDLKVREFPKIS